VKYPGWFAAGASQFIRDFVETSSPSNAGCPQLRLAGVPKVSRSRASADQAWDRWHLCRRVSAGFNFPLYGDGSANISGAKRSRAYCPTQLLEILEEPAQLAPAENF
jgi:hypothetical protein